MSCYMGWGSLAEELTFLFTLMWGYIIGKFIEAYCRYYEDCYNDKSNSTKFKKEVKNGK